MKTLAGLMILTLSISGFVLADPPAADGPPADPLLQFQRDQRLIQVLVEGGMQLASESDPLKRADTCNGLADQVSREIEQAARDKDGSRATALSHHLETMLVRGVAFNVTRARSALPPGAARPKALDVLLGNMDRFTGSAEEGLKHMAAAFNDDGESTLRPLQQGRQVVRRAIQGDGPLFIPADPK